MSDMQAAQLLYRIHKPKRIVTVYADKPFIKLEFVKCIKVTLSQDLGIKSPSKYFENDNLLKYYGITKNEFYGIRMLSIIVHHIKEKKKDRIKICWAVDENKRKMAKFIASTAFYLKDVDEDCQYYDLKLEFAEECKEGGEDTIMIPMFRYIPHLTEEDIEKLVKTFRERERNRILLITLGGPEHNVFLAYFINFTRGYDWNKRAVFDMANAWDHEYLRQTHKRNVPTLKLNSEGFIQAKIIKEPGSKQVEYKEKSAALLLTLKDVLDGVDLLSIIGVGKYAALFTKMGLAYIVLNETRIRRRSKLHFPGLYILENDDYISEIEGKKLAYDDPVVMLDKVKDIILKSKLEPVAMGEVH
ncbi:MAG: hypothetical protein ACP5LQ_08960 [Candidatus Methanodesulfokora sp.]